MRRIVLLAMTAVLVVACGSDVDPGPEPADLTVSHGCGYGFAVGNEDETVGLVLTFTDFDAATQGDVGQAYDIPDDAWDADLSFGHDLFSNWCDDVIEPGEPEVIVDQVAEVSGRLDIETLPEPGTCGLAKATLSDASYRTPDGTVELEDLELINDSWGCFAG